ncbi:MAG: c-type cytochrome biogenesis protein CcmI [Gammaproteobacteria bacterium]|nr:MAG: c-type cytochrome biogenesis protein CcmI [Gammaproteobacteria bacterium]
MVDFWVGATLLLMLAIVLLIYPLVRRYPNHCPSASEKTQTVRVFKDRLIELQAEKASGLITDEKFRALKIELEASLVYDVADQTGKASSEKVVVYGRSQKLMMASVLALFAISSSIFFYGQFGAYSALQEAREFALLESTDYDNSKQLADMIAILEAKLKANPDNLHGWLLLGKAYMNLNRFQQAATVFGKAIPLLEEQGENPASVYGLQAQALYFANQGAFTDAVKTAVTNAYRLNPDEPNILGLLGMMSMQVGQYESAIGYWSRILQVNPEYPGRASIQFGIDEARKKMADTGVAETPLAAQAAGGSEAAGPKNQ